MSETEKSADRKTKSAGAEQKSAAAVRRRRAGTGPPKKGYSPKELRDAVERYFASVCRTVAAEDRNGEPLLNDSGEVIRRVQYVVPPSINGLCLFLGIGRAEWAGYRDAEKDPELARVAELAEKRIEVYLESELVTRGSGVQGLIFNLQNNYGYRRGGDAAKGEVRRDPLEGMSLAEKLDAAERAAEGTEVSGDGERDG